jgi:hypothetical protein
MPTAQKVDNIDPEIEEAEYPFQGIGLNLFSFLVSSHDDNNN